MKIKFKKQLVSIYLIASAICIRVLQDPKRLISVPKGLIDSLSSFTEFCRKISVYLRKESLLHSILTQAG